MYIYIYIQYYVKVFLKIYMKSALQTPAGRLAIGFGRPAGIWSADFIVLYVHTIFYTCLYMFIFIICSYHHSEFSAQCDVKINRFGTLGDNASFP